jgi:hypothetical protein
MGDGQQAISFSFGFSFKEKPGLLKMIVHSA